MVEGTTARAGEQEIEGDSDYGDEVYGEEDYTFEDLADRERGVDCGAGGLAQHLDGIRGIVEEDSGG